MWGGHSKLRYAIIGLAPYSFRYDLSKSFRNKSRILPYLIAFNDVHNFPIPLDVYRKFLLEEWLAQKPSIQKVNINGLKSLKVMNDNTPLIFDILDAWNKKHYLSTRDENIKILDDYLTLCEENNIRPIMTMAPFTEKMANTFTDPLREEFYTLVEQALSKHPDARFIDCLKWDGVTYDDFFDHAHLNTYGAAKFSSYLNDFIEQLDKQGG